MIRTNVGVFVPARLAQCLAILKIQMIFIAKSTGDDIDFAMSNWGYSCGPNFCVVPPNFTEILVYAKTRFGY
jgi:hypothetical protein